MPSRSLSPVSDLQTFSPSMGLLSLSSQQCLYIEKLLIQMKSGCSLFLFILFFCIVPFLPPLRTHLFSKIFSCYESFLKALYITTEMYHLFSFNFMLKSDVQVEVFLTSEFLFVPTLSAFKTILPLNCFDKNHMAVIARVHFCCFCFVLFFLIFCSLDLSFPLVLYYPDCCNYMITCQISLILFFFKIYFEYCFLFIFKTRIHTHIPHWDFVKNHITLWSVLDKIQILTLLTQFINVVSLAFFKCFLCLSSAFCSVQDVVHTHFVRFIPRLYKQL